jgi:glucose-1-phosphate thymidylyltransferase
MPLLEGTDGVEKMSKSYGNHIGLNISYAKQSKPNGIAEAFIIGENFIGKDNVCLILGDNIFYGGGFTKLLINCVKKVTKSNNALVFGYYVNDAKRYGVVEQDLNSNVLSIEEKPEFPKSNYAVVGLYFYPNTVVEISKKIKPSARGELEITSINQYYLKNNQLKVELLDKDFTWLDSGTHESMLEASNYIHTIEKRKGLKVACIEEIAFRMGYITKDELCKIAEPLQNNPYGKYLMQIVLK